MHGVVFHVFAWLALKIFKPDDKRATPVHDRLAQVVDGVFLRVGVFTVSSFMLRRRQDGARLLMATLEQTCVYERVDSEGSSAG
jgi:hypothetical protein